MTEDTPPGPATPAGPDRRSRAAGAVAGVLSSGAAVLLAAVWYDDGTTAERGPLVLGPIAGAPDIVPGLGWVRFAVVLVGAASVLAAAALLAGRPRRPAASAREPGPFATTGRPAREPGPFVTTHPPVRRPAREPGPFGTSEDPAPPDRPRRSATWAALGAAAAATVTGVAAWRLGGHATPVVPAAALVLAGAALAWTLVALRSRAALPGALAAALAVAVAAPLAGPWWAYGRLVDRSTTDLPPSAAGTAGPAAPGAISGTRPFDAGGAFGPYLVLQVEDPDGRPRIVVQDLATGRQRWSHRHGDAYTGIAADPGSGSLVLALDRDGAGELRAFDLASGRPLWNRREAAEVVGQGRFDGSAVLLPGLVLLLDRRAGRLRALDPRTGADRWQRPLPDPYCYASSEYTRVGELLLVTSLCGAWTSVPAWRADTGADAWTAPVSAESTRTTGSFRSPLVAGGVVAVWVGDGRAGTLVGVDGGTGRVRWRRAVDPDVLPAVVAGGRFVVVERTGAGRRAVAIDPAGGRTVWATPLPAVPPAPPDGDTQQVAGTDGERLYVLTGVYPGGPGSTRLTALDRDGRLLGTGRFDGCRLPCDPAALTPSDDAQLAAAAGTLVVVPPRLALSRRLVAIVDGPAFSRPAG